MEELILFIVCFIIIFIAYEIFIVMPMMKYKKNLNRKKKPKKEKKDPVEVRFLVFKYGLDLEKVNYNSLLQVVALVSSLDMAIVVSIIALVEGYFLQMLLAVIVIIPLIFISYGMVAKVYEKKGMIKNV